MDEKENTRELIVVDIKRYKKVKKALHESEERYRQLFENVPIGIYRTTPDGRILDANPALVAMLGFASFAELATKNVSKDFLEASYSRSAFVSRLEREGEIKGLESLWVKKDGVLIHVRENAKLTHSEDGQVLFEGTVEDISQSKLAEEEQKTRAMQLEVLNRLICSGNQADSLSEFLSTILDQVTMLLEFDMAAIYLFENDSQQMTIKAHKGASKGFLRQASSISIADYPFSQVLNSGQSLFAGHLRDEQPQLAKKWHWRATACVPLICKGLVIGTLNLASCQRSDFLDSEKEILDLIGKEAGTLISKLQTEMALRESEKYYRTLIEISPDIIVTMDLDANLLTVNQRFLQSGGYFFDEVIGFSAYDFISGLDRVLFEKKTSNFVKKKKVSKSEYLFRKKDGRTLPLEVSATLLNDDLGRPKGILAIGRDVTERKRGEEQLRFLSSITENISDAITVTDTNFAITYINKVAENFFGYKLDELKDKTPGIFNADPMAEQIQQELYKIVSSGKSYLGESLNRRKDGSTFYCEYKVMPLKDSDGMIYAYTSLQRNITERKQAEHELLESKALIDAVVENVPLMIFIKEATDLRFVIFNRTGEELLGHDRKNLLGKNNLDLFPAEQSAFFMAKDREVLAGGTGMLDIPEEPILTAKKGTRLLHTRKVCIRGADGATKYLLGISEDITERKEAEAKLLAYQEQLRALTSEIMLVEEKERRRIACELHDQIGQNLALCKLKIAALEKNLGDDAMIVELAVVRRLLECSIQDARSLIFDLSPPILYELGFAAALEWLAERIQEQFHVPVEFESRLKDPELKNDQQVILFQVVRELLINVGKHSRASQAKIILSHEGQALRIQVNDDGVGFDASQIFAPREQKSGFGFFSIRERLNYLGGVLEVKSRPGQGSQIILTVPQKGSGTVPMKENS